LEGCPRGVEAQRQLPAKMGGGWQQGPGGLKGSVCPCWWKFIPRRVHCPLWLLSLGCTLLRPLPRQHGFLLLPFIRVHRMWMVSKLFCPQHQPSQQFRRESDVIKVFNYDVSPGRRLGDILPSPPCCELSRLLRCWFSSGSAPIQPNSKQYFLF
jgi:hypothetical protein